ncbi:hypothetical protein HCY99_08905 [Limosilactobacillus fermentum]
MTKPSKEVEKIEQLLADPWAVDIEELWQQAAHNPDKDLRKRITSTSRRYFDAMRNNDGKHEPVKNAENYLYGTMQNLFGVLWNKQANEKYRATHPDNF